MSVLIVHFTTVADDVTTIATTRGWARGNIEKRPRIDRVDDLPGTCRGPHSISLGSSHSTCARREHQRPFFIPCKRPSASANASSRIVSPHSRAAIFCPSGVYSIPLNLSPSLQNQRIIATPLPCWTDSRRNLPPHQETAVCLPALGDDGVDIGGGADGDGFAEGFAEEPEDRAQEGGLVALEGGVFDVGWVDEGEGLGRGKG